MIRLLDVDPSDAVPIWKQIEDGVRRLVSSERMPAGSAVPSVRELARELRVNPATVAKAYRRLTDDGVLSVRRGEGTYVAERTREERRRDRRRLLLDGARDFVDVARSIDADRDEADEAICAAWDEATSHRGGER
jgi:GntR family transcriptional regulator